MDISELMLRRDEELDINYQLKPIRIVGDEEAIPFAPKSLNLVISNLTLHWVNDLPGALGQVRHILKDNGLFLASILGNNTLTELRNSFFLAEQEREGGISPHVSPMTMVGDVGNLISGAGFTLPTVDKETITIHYRDPFVLMNDLQCMAENNASLQRRLFVPRKTFIAAAAIYQQLYGNDKGEVPATFEVIYMTGWTPHESQPKSKERGSATYQLSNLDKLAKTDPSNEGNKK